jgi:hypothetical protein
MQEVLPKHRQLLPFRQGGAYGVLNGEHGQGQKHQISSVSVHKFRWYGFQLQQHLVDITVTS